MGQAASWLEMWEGAILGAVAPSLQPAGEKLICSLCPLQDIVAAGLPQVSPVPLAFAWLEHLPLG